MEYGSLTPGQASCGHWQSSGGVVGVSRGVLFRLEHEQWKGEKLPLVDNSRDGVAGMVSQCLLLQLACLSSHNSLLHRRHTVGIEPKGVLPNGL